MDNPYRSSSSFINTPSASTSCKSENTCSVTQSVTPEFRSHKVTFTQIMEKMKVGIKKRETETPQTILTKYKYPGECASALSRVNRIKEILAAVKLEEPKEYYKEKQRKLCKHMKFINKLTKDTQELKSKSDFHLPFIQLIKN
mmetsp:Transcript_35112/g.40575  ORF Transcript_35112/g.40575 Transcript_35112/m.40575 type:complete len:143 (+) Transcript_35112:196-624(+)|eukprot:CAMPEP_0168326266 /NCGR_PEP_ID=MMETSP0213-20121227/5194_1 /TAXON_ID=151035 /ORGANISM="Euplotes harpa, Strain FSP1.4" /LENGTH=142 /DNA_ID=CAMNT_0008328935 /DNA_START=330 /DNA_END=758 /DNA_ORIENTATION=+